MLKDTFEHDQIRKYTIIMGALFDNLYVNRDDNSNNLVQKIKIPLTYGPKDKILARLLSNPDATNQVAISIPRMSFELTTLSYDPDRKLQNLQQIVAKDPGDQLWKRTYTPVAYNIGYSVYIVTKSQTDGFRTVEQIIPTFRPQYTVKAEIVKELGITHDIAIVLDSVGLNHSYEGSFKEMPALIWQMNFTLKGYFYDIINDTGLIKFIQARFPNQSIETTIQPSLTANGQPTSDINETIPYQSINKEDDWGVIVNLETPYVP